MLTERYTKHASSQRKEPSREIILTRSHIRATADGYESIKISHREPRVGRGNISNIRRADPSPAPYPLSITTLTGLLASYISFPRLSSLPTACCLFALLLSRRETHFLSTAPARIFRTRAVNFSFFSPYKRFSFSSFLFLLLLSSSIAVHIPFFSRSHTFYVVFPDMSRGHEYVNPGLGS